MLKSSKMPGKEKLSGVSACFYPQAKTLISFILFSTLLQPEEKDIGWYVQRVFLIFKMHFTEVSKNKKFPLGAIPLFKSDSVKKVSKLLT